MIIPFESLSTIRPRRCVMAAGCFDLFHVGHLHYLKAAKTFGHLVVALTKGEFFIKQGRPVFTDSERLEMVDALRIVAYTVLVPERTMVSAIRELRPSVYVKGSETRLVNNPDFDAEKSEVEKHGGRIVMIPKILPYSSGALLSGEFLKEVA